MVAIHAALLSLSGRDHACQVRAQLSELMNLWLGYSMVVIHAALLSLTNLKLIDYRKKKKTVVLFCSVVMFNSA